MIFLETTPPTLIAEGSRVQGELIFQASVRVFGTIEGGLSQESIDPLHIGRSGWVHGNIIARGPVMVEGRVEGNIHSTTRVRLLPTAIVRGSISAPRIEIRPGAILEGEIHATPETRRSAKAA